MRLSSVVAIAETAVVEVAAVTADLAVAATPAAARAAVREATPAAVEEVPAVEGLPARLPAALQGFESLGCRQMDPERLGLPPESRL